MTPNDQLSVNESNRIEGNIESFSRKRWLVTMGYVLTVFGVIGFGQWGRWQVQVSTAVFLLTLIAGVWSLRRPAWQCRYLAQHLAYKSAESDTQWQLGVNIRNSRLKTHRHQQDNLILLQATLQHAKSLGMCVHLKFDIFHPVQQTKSIVIWQDQVSPVLWRQLQTIAIWQ